MRTPSLIDLTCACCLACLCLCPEEARPSRDTVSAHAGRATGTTSATAIPEVHFAIFRLTPDPVFLVGLYEFSQPYRKSLPPPGYTQSMNILYRFVWPGDFGWVDVESRLTGARILRATSWWAGVGSFEYPPDSLMSTTLEHGFTNPAPDTLIDPGIPYGADVDYAWALVQDTDAIARLAAYGGYEAYAWTHNYAEDGTGPIYELFIIAATHPVAPDDMAMLEVSWPRTLVTRGLPTTPEVLVHNFGDAPTDLLVTLGVAGDPGQYHSIQEVGVLPRDQSRAVKLDPLHVYSSAVLTFNYAFITPLGEQWVDLYPYNDAQQQSVRITDQPVFRYTPSISTRGLPCDFDDDGDADIVAFQSTLRLWRNDGSAHFTDVTAASSFPARHNPGFAVCGDFNGDHHADLFVSYWGAQGQMLAGDGSGAFTDVTAASGLAGVTTYDCIVAVDKENDNDLDLVIASTGQEPVLENDGSGHFIAVTGSSGIVDGGQTLRIAAGDLNRDGYPDLVLANWQQDAAAFINDGDGTFTRLNLAWGVNFQRDVVLFDYDGDQDEDIFFLQEIYGPSRLYRNNGNLTFSGVAPPTGGFPNDIAVDAGDFNEDGRVDLAFTNGALFMNTGGAFADTSALLVDLPVKRMALGGDVHFVDLNGDGHLDVYGMARAYLNQGVAGPVVGVKDTPVMPPSSYLAQNYPNPFNPTTAIRYRIGETGPVTLAIYNVAGQLVKTLVSQVQHPGTEERTATWDGRNNSGERVASGVYLCRLVAPGFSQTRKLVLLK